MFVYSTSGTCSRQIVFEVNDENDTIHNVKFIGGCSGNLQGIGKLVEGRKLDEVETTLAGIRCKGNTSCPDQLSKAVKAYRDNRARSAK
ncbi:MAG: TIGR03905 family TSCPD domain-containing protein [Clostridia bacterium]|nr:TIGR03905 family TSCPD domain-containing protein [Clostridia bacterium]